MNRRSPHLAAGSVLVGLILLAALFAPWLSAAPPDAVRPALALLPPGPGAPLGTDAFGRDLLSRLVWGARLALELALSAALLAGLPGIALGLLAGYRRGWFDEISSRAMDAWMSLPGMLVAVILVARLGPSLQTTVLAVGLMGVPSFYRIARGGALSLGQAAYVEAARALGAGEGRILWRHVLPNLASPLVALGSLRMSTALLTGAGLSFIGLGPQPPAPDWGALLAGGREYLDSAWWLAFFPGLAITTSVMGFSLLGDGLRDTLAPRR